MTHPIVRGPIRQRSVRRFARVVLSLLLSAPFPAIAVTVAEIEARQTSAQEALQGGHFAEAYSRYQSLLRVIPDHPRWQLRLAQSLVGLGRVSKANAVFRDIVSKGFGAILVDDPSFAKMAGQPGFEEMRRLVIDQSAPIAAARQAFEIPEQRYIAEGVAFDPGSGRFFFSSTYLRKITVREPDGRMADFVPPKDHGLLQALGMKVDSPRSRLLVLTATDDARLIDFNPSELGRSGVLSYDLATGHLLKATWLPAPGVHLFNDLVVTSDGIAYITDSDEGRIYRLSADGNELSAITSAGALLYPNGIDIDPLRNCLYVADLRGVFTVNLATGMVLRLPQAKAISTADMDGLYLHGDDLIGVQTIAQADRVMAFHLSKDHRRILSADALERADARLSGPTEGVVVGDQLYFVANGFQSAVDEKGIIASPEKTAPTPILALPLP